MLAIGPKIIVYQFFDGQRLIGTAFFDAQLFIVSLNSVKNWVIVGDVLKSVYFLRWKVSQSFALWIFSTSTLPPSLKKNILTICSGGRKVTYPISKRFSAFTSVLYRIHPGRA